ncbi:MAG: integrase, partial [Paracoccaceae bacterium]|nr:integrase [Paracoccaceae bacterium]
MEPRNYIWLSLHTDSPDIGRQKAPKVWADMIEAWEAKLDGDTADAEARFAAARELAAKRGYRFLTAKQVASLPQDEFMARVSAVMESSRPGKPDLIEAAALLGGAPEPAITISRALDIFWERTADRRRGKSSDQVRRWGNPFKKAVANFIGVVGNKPISEITRAEMLDFKDWWSDRIEAEGLTAGSGNKDFSHINSILNTVNDDLRLGLVLPTGKLAIKDGNKRVRPPFSDEFIRTKILAPGALDGLNT